MLRIVVKRFIIYGGIFSAINFAAWSAEYTPSWSQRQQQAAACYMTGDETCITFIDDAVRQASRQYGKRSIQLVRSLLLQSDIYQWLGKPELTPHMLLKARAIMNTFPADRYPGDRADMFEHLAAFSVYRDESIEDSPAEHWRYKIKVDYRQRIAWQEQALTWRLKDKKASTDALVFSLNRMRDVYSFALQEWDVACDSTRKAYYLAKIDETEQQWLSIILRDQTWANRERYASFLRQKARINDNEGHIAEAINALNQSLKIGQTLYGAEISDASASDLNNLGNYYARNHCYQEAANLYLKLLAYYQSRLGQIAPTMAWLRAYLPENIAAASVDNASLHIPFLEAYKDLQSDLSTVAYNLALLYQDNHQLDQAKVFAERAYELNVAIGPERIQYKQLQQLADIAEGRGDNVQARRYRQMSFRYRTANTLYPGEPQYNDAAEPGGDRCG
ncbi:hypothetical protein H3N91_003129 [Salmonella enterica]|nr:hypothetical protein [Salmonella enterica]EEA2273217.1 hypothetical protein [Salmonella enterica]EFV5117627.1 hypothetical protein [Salmonella enterica]EGB7060510.1 hypothetical protein [Salmonella enterica]EKL9527007.1 hypothetical protein [Salmonella enterica]